MRRHKPHRESISVSLFPFLAVLICTFGVLIILLVLVVKAADQQAANKNQELIDRHENEKAELVSDLEFQQLRVEGLRSVPTRSCQTIAAGPPTTRPSTIQNWVFNG